MGKQFEKKEITSTSANLGHLIDMIDLDVIHNEDNEWARKWQAERKLS